MSEKIQLRRSAVAGRVPTTSQLDLGEIGINTHDGKVYIKKDAGTPEIVEVGGGYDDLEDIIEDLPSMISTTYLFDTNSAGNVATASTVHLNSSNWSTATIIYASVVNSKGKRVDMAAMEYLKFGARILLQDMSGTGTNYLKAVCTGASSNSTTITIGINNSANLFEPAFRPASSSTLPSRIRIRATAPITPMRLSFMIASIPVRSRQLRKASAVSASRSAW